MNKCKTLVYKMIVNRSWVIDLCKLSQTKTCFFNNYSSYICLPQKQLKEFKDARNCWSEIVEKLLTEKHIRMREIFCTISCYKNDVVYLPMLEDISVNPLNVKRFLKKSSVIVCVALSNNGILPMKLVHIKIKINAEHFRLDISATHLLPQAAKFHSRLKWILQQDSVPLHRAKSTQVWLHVNCPKFIMEEISPLHLLDLTLETI